MVFEVHFIYAWNDPFTRHSVPETLKYKQKKTNIDTDYEYINRKQQELPSEC